MLKPIANIIKFALALVILPVLVAGIISFVMHLNALPQHFGDYFFWGAVAYVLVHLFIFEPTAVYEKGHTLIKNTCKFFPAVVEVLVFCVPIYAVLVLSAYFLSFLFGNISPYAEIFIAGIGFFFAFHLVNSARLLNSRGDDFLKGDYFLSFELITVMVVLITGGMLRALTNSFSFVSFLTEASRITQQVYFVIVRQLFIPS